LRGTFGRDAIIAQSAAKNKFLREASLSEFIRIEADQGGFFRPAGSLPQRRMRTLNGPFFDPEISMHRQGGRKLVLFKELGV
jgi:hypothetical protein